MDYSGLLLVALVTVVLGGIRHGLNIAYAMWLHRHGFDDAEDRVARLSQPRWFAHKPSETLPPGQDSANSRESAEHDRTSRSMRPPKPLAATRVKSSRKIGTRI
jgi:hypothetical protein